MRSALAWTLAAALAASIAGCQVRSGASRAYRPPAGPRPAPVAGGPVAPGPPPPPAPPDEGPRADPEASRTFLASMGQPAMELLVSPVSSRVTALALENTARGEASGMAPIDPLKGALLMEGQRARTPVAIGAGECVTFIAQGGLGVIEVDTFLVTGGSPPVIVAEDPTTGPIAVIGGRGACFRSPTPLSGELHVRVRRGAGIVIVQAYRKQG